MRVSRIEQELEGTLQKVVYKDDLTGWSVVKFALVQTGQSITVVGSFFCVQTKEALRIRGKWVNSAEYGQQFQMSSYLSISPKTLTGIREYLAS